MSISKGEQCTLLDNQQKIKWRVRNSTGQEGLIPAVCFVIPPPNKEAIHLAETCVILFPVNNSMDLSSSRLFGCITDWGKTSTGCEACGVTSRGNWRSSWSLPPLRLSKRGTSKRWGFTYHQRSQTWGHGPHSWICLLQFKSLPPSQREAIMKALNEDAEKLMSEYPPGDPQVTQLQEEMRQCNQIFDQLSSRVRDEATKPSPSADLINLLEQVNFTLDQLDRTLSGRLHEPLPNNNAEVLSLLDRHKYFENDLRSLEPSLERIQEGYQSLSRSHRTPEVETKLSLVVEKWEQLASQSKLYVDRWGHIVHYTLCHFSTTTFVFYNHSAVTLYRLKASEMLHKALNELNEMLHEHEETLAVHQTLSSEPRVLRHGTEQLQVSTCT